MATPYTYSISLGDLRAIDQKIRQRRALGGEMPSHEIEALYRAALDNASKQASDDWFKSSRLQEAATHRADQLGLYRDQMSLAQDKQDLMRQKLDAEETAAKYGLATQLARDLLTLDYMTSRPKEGEKGSGMLASRAIGGLFDWTKKRLFPFTL